MSQQKAIYIGAPIGTPCYIGGAAQGVTISEVKIVVWQLPSSKCRPSSKYRKSLSPTRKRCSSVSNFVRYSCRNVPQSTPGTSKTKSCACYSLRGPTIWRESSTVFTSVPRMRQAFTGPHLSRSRPYGTRASRALVPSLTLLQRFLVGDSDFRYFEDGRHSEDGELQHHIPPFADRDALGDAPNYTPVTR